MSCFPKLAPLCVPGAVLNDRQANNLNSTGRTRSCIAQLTGTELIIIHFTDPQTSPAGDAATG